MRIWLFIVGLLLCGSALAQQQPASTVPRFFPYPWKLDTLTNGLRVVTVPTEHTNLVAFYIVVRVGSRNEVEAGKTGFAHFFEHMMFRGSENFTPAERDAIMKQAGAESNAYTTDDRTVYHALFSTKDLEKIMELEADRFQRLKYDEPVYKTEALAVMGEYNKSSVNPMSKLWEVLRERAFTTHTYKHTTIGFIQDIEAMPKQYQYSLEFYRRYYRPEYCTLLLVGDVKHETSMALAEKYFGAWERGSYKPVIPPEPEQKKTQSVSVDWPSPTLPYLAIAYHAPSYSDRIKDKAALDFLVPIAFGENSELYQKLVLKEQKVEMLAVAFDDQIDPELFTVIARIKDPAAVNYVRDQIVETFNRFARDPVSLAKLNETRSHIRYSTALGWTSAGAIAGFLAPYLALAGTPATVDRLFALYQQIAPKDILEAAKRYFHPENRTVVALEHKPKEVK